MNPKKTKPVSKGLWNRSVDGSESSASASNVDFLATAPTPPSPQQMEFPPVEVEERVGKVPASKGISKAGFPLERKVKPEAAAEIEKSSTVASSTEIITLSSDDEGESYSSKGRNSDSTQSYDGTSYVEDSDVCRDNPADRSNSDATGVASASAMQCSVYAICESSSSDVTVVLDDYNPMPIDSVDKYEAKLRQQKRKRLHNDSGLCTSASSTGHQSGRSADMAPVLKNQKSGLPSSNLTSTASSSHSLSENNRREHSAKRPRDTPVTATSFATRKLPVDPSRRTMEMAMINFIMSVLNSIIAQRRNQKKKTDKEE